MQTTWRHVPIIFVFFNRPDHTLKVLAAIRQARPSKLYLVADGPRADVAEDAALCEKTRRLVQEGIDWLCEVVPVFSDVNLGSGGRCASGFDRVFAEEEEAIILEDDCLPNTDFFPFCSELLERYRDDERVMSIAGTNEQEQWKSEQASYFFSIYGRTWGWATWRRAWQHFDFRIPLWGDEDVKRQIRDLVRDPVAVRQWSNAFDRCYEEDVRSVWDFQWRFARWVNSGLTVVPSVNLVCNIGSGESSTHTERDKSMATHALGFPLRHPPAVMPDGEYDRLWMPTTHPLPPLWKRLIPQLIKDRLKRMLGRKVVRSYMRG